MNVDNKRTGIAASNRRNEYVSILPPPEDIYSRSTIVTQNYV